MPANWSTQPIWNSHAVVLAIAAALLALLLIGPAFGRLTLARRGVLTGLRIGVVILVLLAMLRPTHISSTARRQSAVLVMLLDQSRSMQLPAAAGGASRWQAQRETLFKSEGALSELAEDLEVKVYAYDQQLSPLELVNGRMNLPDSADGSQTDIGSTLHAAFSREVGKRLAGVILLGDGVQTAFEPRVELQQAGRELARLGYPLYTVTFGPAGDAAQARDVAIENLPEQYTVFVKNELIVTGWLHVRGYVNQEIPVELVVQHPDGETQVLGPQRLRAREDGERVEVRQSFVPQQPGQYKLTMRAAVQAGELVTKNNELSAFLTVLEGGLKVLYLEGAHRNEVRFLRRSVNASPDMQVDFDLLERPAAERGPIELSDILEAGQYDALILGDLDSTVLGRDNLKLLAEAVARGAGLIMLGGLHSFGPGGYHDTALADVLPIVMDRFERQDFERPIREDLHLAGRLQMLPVRPHPVTRLAPGEENLAAWKRLKPLIGANKFAAVKQSPGVQVLAETADGAPLLVAGQYQQGRVLALAADSTWLWCMQGRQADHKRFWRQVILWLVRRDDLNQEDVWIKLPQRRYHPGGRVTFTAGARTAAGDVIHDAALEAQLRLPDGRRESLQLSADGEHWFGSIATVQQPGDYLVEVTASSQGKSVGTARADFQVLDQDVELSNPAADPDQFARLAHLTREVGGKTVAPEQLPTLLREIKQRPPDLEIQVQTRWQFADTWWDAWLFFAGLIALLGSEWALRKKWGLV